MLPRVLRGGCSRHRDARHPLAVAPLALRHIRAALCANTTTTALLPLTSTAQPLAAACTAPGRRLASTYAADFAEARDSPETFWGRQADQLHWDEPWRQVLDFSQPPHAQWFVGGRTNMAYNALDRQVAAGLGNKPALIYDSPMTSTQRHVTYAELLRDSSQLAGLLSELGVVQGDRVVIYMPMVPETVVAMLACARIGAVHSVVFGGFASPELAARINDADAKVVLAASCGLEPGRVVPYKPLLDGALELAEHKPQHCVILQRPQGPEAALVPGRDLDWATAVARAAPADCVSVDANDPLYILYTSGSTGKPKGVLRTLGGHMTALKWSMQAIFNIGRDDTWFCASDLGWVVGHSYICYAPLLTGCTSVLYEGKPVGTPDAGAYFRLLAEHGVKTMFSAPTALRAMKMEDPHGSQAARYDLSKFETLFLAGERTEPEISRWAAQVFKSPVVDHYWQTEAGSPMIATCMGYSPDPAEIVVGSCGKPVPGWDIQVLDNAHKPTATNTLGHIGVRLPMPPGALATLWNDEDRFLRSYMQTIPGYYDTGDVGIQDDQGNISVMSRTEDIINCAGHRLSTGVIEEALTTHTGVAQAAVIAVEDAVKGHVPVGLLVLTAKAAADNMAAQIEKDVVQLVRERVGPVAAFKKAIVVPALPKTRSGKTLRGVLSKMANGKPFTAPPTIENHDVLHAVQNVLRSRNLPPQRS